MCIMFFIIYYWIGMWGKYCKTIEIFLLLLILFTGIKYLYCSLKIAFSVINYLDLYILGKNEYVILLISVLFC